MIEKIFDAVVIVGLYSPDCQSEEPFITPTTPHERSSSLFSNTSESTAKNEVVTIYSFIESDFPVPPSIGWFCFPEKAAHYSSTFRRDDTFMFCLTTQQNTREYGYCLRFSMGQSFLSECICLLTAHPWQGVMEEIVTVLYSLYLKTRSQFSPKTIPNPVKGDFMTPFLAAFSKLPQFPLQGQVFDVTFMKDERITSQTVLSFKRPLEICDVPVNLDLSPLFTHFSASTIAALHMWILLEHPVVVVGDSIADINAFCHLNYICLTPFEWNSVFVPVLPWTMRDYLSMPVPSIVGCPIENVCGLEACLSDKAVVNLSTSTIFYPKSFDHNIMQRVATPQPMPNATLNLPADQFTVSPPSIFWRVASMKIWDFQEALSSEVRLLVQSRLNTHPQSMRILAVFFRFHASLFLRYRQYFKDVNSIEVQKDSWIHSFSRDYRPFLREFVNTRLFVDFMYTRIEHLTTVYPNKTPDTPRDSKTSKQQSVSTDPFFPIVISTATATNRFDLFDTETECVLEKKESQAKRVFLDAERESIGIPVSRTTTPKLTPLPISNQLSPTLRTEATSPSLIPPPSLVQMTENPLRPKAGTTEAEKKIEQEEEFVRKAEKLKNQARREKEARQNNHRPSSPVFPAQITVTEHIATSKSTNALTNTPSGREKKLGALPPRQADTSTINDSTDNPLVLHELNTSREAKKKTRERGEEKRAVQKATDSLLVFRDFEVPEQDIEEKKKAEDKEQRRKERQERREAEERREKEKRRAEREAERLEREERTRNRTPLSEPSTDRPKVKTDSSGDSAELDMSLQDFLEKERNRRRRRDSPKAKEKQTPKLEEKEEAKKERKRSPVMKEEQLTAEGRTSTEKQKERTDRQKESGEERKRTHSKPPLSPRVLSHSSELPSAHSTKRADIVSLPTSIPAVRLNQSDHPAKERHREHSVPMIARPNSACGPDTFGKEEADRKKEQRSREAERLKRASQPIDTFRPVPISIPTPLTVGSTPPPSPTSSSMLDQERRPHSHRQHTRSGQTEEKQRGTLRRVPSDEWEELSMPQLPQTKKPKMDDLSPPIDNPLRHSLQSNRPRVELRKVRAGEAKWESHNPLVLSPRQPLSPPSDVEYAPSRRIRKTQRGQSDFKHDEERLSQPPTLDMHDDEEDDERRPEVFRSPFSRLTGSKRGRYYAQDESP